MVVSLSSRTVRGALVAVSFLALLVTFAPRAAAAPPAKLRLVVLDVSGGERILGTRARQALLQGIVLEAQRWDALDTTSVAELRAAMKLVTEREQAGCDGGTCAAEIADAFGARYVIFSVLSRLGSVYSLQISLFDSDDARVIGRAAARGATVAQLEEALPGAMTQVMSALGAPKRKRAVVEALSAAPPGARSSGRATAGQEAWPDVTIDDVPTEPRATVSDAEASCRYLEEEGRYGCDETTAVRIFEGLVATAGEVRVEAVTEGECVRRVEVSVSGVDLPVRVDWREATGLVDDVAVPLAPKTRLDRPATAPARARVQETLAPVGTSDGCLGPRALREERDVVAVTFTYLVGDIPARATWVRQRARTPISEAELLARVPSPVLPARPKRLIADDEERPGFAMTLTGAAVAAGLGSLVGLGVGALAMPPSSTIEQRALVGSGYGGVVALLAAVPAVGIGLVIDGVSQLEHEHARSLSVAYRRAARQRRAWEALQGSE